jgi:surface antigen
MRRIIRGLWRHLRSPLLLTAAALLLLAPVAGFAQYGTTFRSSPKLTSTDIAMIRKLVRQELTGKPNGTTLSWRNPESENSGTVTLIDSFPSRGRDCRRVRYVVNPGPKQASFARSATYVLTNCRLPDGTWQIDKQARRDTSGQ